MDKIKKKIRRIKN